MRGLPRPVRAILERAFCFAAGTIVAGTLFHSQGLYIDGWASKRFHYMLSSGCRRVRISGSLPETIRRLRGQEIQVICNGRRLGSFAVPTGDFEIDVDLPAEFVDQALFLRIVAKKSIVETPFSLRVDRRRLAYKVRSVSSV